MPHLSVANLNTHAGVDGWGRPYDLTEACQQLDADVIVMQEIFAPLEGPSQADEIAESLGYTSTELPLARAWLTTDPTENKSSWGPKRGVPGYKPVLRVGGRIGRRTWSDDWIEGTWGIAILSKLAVISSEAFEFGKLKRDFTHRGALAAELGIEARPGKNFVVIGTHAAHFSAGSHMHFRQLHDRLPKPDVPAVVLGDMNLWGPPVSLLLPGWRRAVKGRTWPAWRPHSQIDHILVPTTVSVLKGEVRRAGNSDHLAVRAEISW